MEEAVNQRLRDFSWLTLAVFAGFVGGAALTQRRSAEAAPGIVRATRFELLDDSGRTLAVLGRTPTRDTGLSFLASDGKQLAVLGVEANQMAFLTLAGGDGNGRADLRIGWHERPFLVMGDEKFRVRVKLGYLAYDSPAPEDENWGVAFGAPLGFRSLASIGYLRDPVDGTIGGSVFVEDAKGKIWRAP